MIRIWGWASGPRRTWAACARPIPASWASTCAPRWAGGPIPGESERLEGPAQAGEAIMLALRTAEGVDVDRFRERYGIDVNERYREVVGESGRGGRARPPMNGGCVSPNAAGS